MKGLPAWVFLTRTWLAADRVGKQVCFVLFVFLGQKRGVQLIHKGGLYNVNYGSLHTGTCTKD